MNNKKTVMKIFVLLSIFLAFFMMSGLKDDGGNDGGAVLAAGNVDWTKLDIKIEDDTVAGNIPPLTAPQGALLFKHSITVRNNSDLFWNQPINVNITPPAGPYFKLENNAYLYLTGSLTVTHDVIVNDYSKICLEGAISASTGKLQITNGSVVYTKAAIGTEELIMDANSYLYVYEEHDETNRKNVTNYIDYEDRIIVIPKGDFDDTFNQRCQKVPGDTPTGGAIRAELEATKSVVNDLGESVELVTVGDILTYTIQVTNNATGSLVLNDVKVEDAIPEGLTLVPGTIKLDDVLVESGLDENGDISVLIPKLDVGETPLISFQVTVDEGLSGEIKNIATVTNPIDVNNPFDTNEVTVTPKGILFATKMASEASVSIEEEFEYMITVSNTQIGSAPLNNVTVADTLPEGIDFVDKVIYVNGEATGNATDDNFEVTIPEVAYGTDVTVSFTARANGNSTGDIVNTATVTDLEGNESDEPPTTTVNVIPKGELVAKKKVSTPDVMVGQGFQYTITVSNSLEGSDSLKNVTVEDTLPDGIEFVNGNINVDGARVVKVTENTFKINLDEVAYGSDKKITFRVRATGDRIGEIWNTANVKLAESEEPGLSPDVEVNIVTGSIQVTKVDAIDNTIVLKGAEFELYKCNNATSLIESCGDPIRTESSGDNGLLKFDNLAHGYYKLKETKAPVGYRLLTKPIDVDLTKVNQRNVKIRVENYKADWELPATGGIGTYLFYGLGSVLMISALYAVLRRKKKGE